MWKLYCSQEDCSHCINVKALLFTGRKSQCINVKALLFTGRLITMHQCESFTVHKKTAHTASMWKLYCSQEENHNASMWKLYCSQEDWSQCINVKALLFTGRLITMHQCESFTVHRKTDYNSSMWKLYCRQGDWILSSNVKALLYCSQGDWSLSSNVKASLFTHTMRCIGTHSCSSISLLLPAFWCELLHIKIYSKRNRSKFFPLSVNPDWDVGQKWNWQSCSPWKCALHLLYLFTWETPDTYGIYTRLHNYTENGLNSIVKNLPGQHLCHCYQSRH